MEEGVDGGKGGCICAYLVFYVYLVSAYRPSHSPLSQSVHFIPLLFHYSLKIGGGLGGANDSEEEALEGDQELDKLLFVRKRPLLAMRPAGSGGEGERLPCQRSSLGYLTRTKYGQANQIDLQNLSAMSSS